MIKRAKMKVTKIFAFILICFLLSVIFHKEKMWIWGTFSCFSCWRGETDADGVVAWSFYTPKTCKWLITHGEVGRWQKFWQKNKTGSQINWHCVITTESLCLSLSLEEQTLDMKKRAKICKLTVRKTKVKRSKKKENKNRQVVINTYSRRGSFNEFRLIGVNCRLLKISKWKVSRRKNYHN